MFKNYRFRDYDFRLVIMLITITVIGILAVGSAEPSLKNKQIIGFVGGFILMVVISFFDYHKILKFWWVLYIINIILLLLVLILGYESGGAQRWLDLKVIRFQPSESAKIILILFFAQFIMKFKDKINDFRFILVSILLAAAPLFMILEQPDLSTTIVLLVVILSAAFVGEIALKYVFAFLGITIPSIVVLFILILQPEYEIIEKYQRIRILAWLHPEEYELQEAFQQLNSIMAIGSGQLTGKGLNNNVVNSVKNGNFISEPQTDFIFTIIGEELGFIGACSVVILLIGITIECLIIAYKSKDLAGRIIAACMGTLIGTQSIINICVTTGLFPNTGLPLPFVSAGLTSLLSLYAGMGFVLNIRLQCTRKYNN